MEKSLDRYAPIISGLGAVLGLGLHIAIIGSFAVPNSFNEAFGRQTGTVLWFSYLFFPAAILSYFFFAFSCKKEINRWFDKARLNAALGAFFGAWIGFFMLMILLPISPMLVSFLLATILSHRKHECWKNDSKAVTLENYERYKNLATGIALTIFILIIVLFINSAVNSSGSSHSGTGLLFFAICSAIFIPLMVFIAYVLVSTRKKRIDGEFEERRD